MADKKISALTGASTPLAGTEVLPIVQSGTTVKVSVADLTAGRAISTGKITTEVSNGAVMQVGSNQTLNTFKYSVFKNFAYNNNAAGVQIIGAKSDSGYTEISYGGGVDGSYATTQHSFYRAANTTTADGTEVFRIDANVTALTGNFVVGTSGKGINFTANTPAAGMTSQLLNWYEEGTFTPTFGNLTIGNGSVWGAYVRSGKVVEVTLGFTWGSTSSIAGTIGNISGLPFSVQAPNGQAFPLVVGTVYKAGVGWFNIVSILSGTTLIATATFAGAGISAVSPAALVTNDSLTLSATYRAA